MCNNNTCGSIGKILSTVVKIQNQGQCNNDCAGGCDRPFLGTPATCLYNTRPVTIHSCPTNTLWTMPYSDTETSTVFRVETVEDCCATFRVLAPGTAVGTYVATDSFFTMNLNCIGAVQCLADTLVTGL